MIGNIGILFAVGAIAITVAMGILKKLEVDVEGKFEHGGYESDFEFEWELEKEKKKRRKKENDDNEKQDSLDTQPEPMDQQQPVVPSSYYYPFYPSVHVPPYYPYFYH